MIKKWNKFILESYSDKKLSEVKDSVGKFMGLERMDELVKSSIISDIFEYLLKYTEWRYDDISKEISNWYKEKFNEEAEGWVGSNWQNKLLKKDYGDKSAIIYKSITLYNKIKDEFDDTGYPKQSQLSKDIELIAVSTLDSLEFYEVYESSNYIFVRIGCDGAEFNIDSLSTATEELIPMCARIKDQVRLENKFINFDKDEKASDYEILLGFIYI